MAAAIPQVAARLGNTVAICRTCYVHPEIVAAFLDGGLALEGGAGTEGLRDEEGAVLAFLRGRVGGCACAAYPYPWVREPVAVQDGALAAMRPARWDGRASRKALSRAG